MVEERIKRLKRMEADLNMKEWRAVNLKFLDHYKVCLSYFFFSCLHFFLFPTSFSNSPHPLLFTHFAGGRKCLLVGRTS